MKRVQYHRYGGPDVLRLEDVEAEPPGRGEVVVRVRAAAANALDWKIRNGEMRPMTGGTFPRGVGNEFAGTVHAVGEGVTRLHVGDRVLGATTMRRPGAFADLVTAPASSVTTMPDGLSFEVAATLPVVGVTALQALTRSAGPLPAQDVFVHGCLGGVGRTAVQLAVRRGAAVAGSCRPTSSHVAAALGVDPVVPFDIDPAPLRHRFDLVIDTVGTLPLRTSRAMLRRGGRIVDIVPTPRKFVRAALPGPYSVVMSKPVVAALDELASTAARGELDMPIARTVPLSDAIRALTDLEAQRTSKGGKLVITME